MYSIKNRDGLENLSELNSLQKEEKALGLQEKPDNENFHEDMV